MRCFPSLILTAEISREVHAWAANRAWLMYYFFHLARLGTDDESRFNKLNSFIFLGKPELFISHRRRRDP